jgi:hypothetical protein
MKVSVKFGIVGCERIADLHVLGEEGMRIQKFALAALKSIEFGKEVLVESLTK